MEGTYIDTEVTLTPWKATGNFTVEKYKMLIEKFGVEEITQDMLERMEKLTGHKPHRLLRRGLFFAHRNLQDILDDYEAGRPIFIYTGRGPTSEALHLGHIVPIEFTAWLQKVFNAFVVFQMADDEKYWFKDMPFEEVYNLGFKNAEDVIALGFNPDKTFIFSNRDYCRNAAYQKVACDIMNKTNVNEVKKIFGFDDDSCQMGQLVWPIYQTTAAFSAAFQDIFGTKDLSCLVAYAIDQDPYFRLARNVAPKLGFKKPCSIMCQFLPSLEGDSKMSSTATSIGPSTTIFMNDIPSVIETKIMKYAFSGGQDTMELHRKLGGNPDVDISFQWLRYFYEDDQILQDMDSKYRKGTLSTHELKKFTAKVISDLVNTHQMKKGQVTLESVKRFYSDKTY